MRPGFSRWMLSAYLFPLSSHSPVLSILFFPTSLSYCKPVSLFPFLGCFILYFLPFICLFLIMPHHPFIHSACIH